MQRVEHRQEGRDLLTLSLTKCERLRSSPVNNSLGCPQSVEAGWMDADWMVEDTALEFLHGDPEFEAIVAEVKKRLQVP